MTRPLGLQKGTPVSTEQKAGWAQTGGLGDLENRKVSCPCRNSKPGLSSPRVPFLRDYKQNKTSRRFIKGNMAATERNSVPCSSVIGSFHFMLEEQNP